MRLLYTLWLFYLLSICECWDYDGTDFEIFDLYEEVNGTFYELLEISHDASVSEIRKAYRQKSLVLHPDKNSAEDADQKFRQLVAVYEVLKDKDKREKYDNVLKNGLPTWRQPAYYYRKYRKMGTLEISLIVSILVTIGHYLTWLVAYYEKKFEMDEVLNPLRKRQEKKKAKGKLPQEDLDTDNILQKELGYRKPTGWDLLPFVIYRFLVYHISKMPSHIKERIDKRKKEKEMKIRKEEEEREAEKAREAEKLRPKRVKEKPTLRDASEFENEEPAVQSLPNSYEFNNTELRSRKDEEWTEEDYASLAKAMCKYPAGTLGRWERIGHDLGRRGDEITKKVKEMKSTIALNLPNPTGTAALSSKKKTAINISDSIITKTIDRELKKTTIISDSDLYQSQYDIPDDYDEGMPCEEEPIEVYTTVKQKVKTRPLEDKPSEAPDNIPVVKTDIAVDSWTQVQQKCLEAAILQFPKSTIDRWSCIARAVPDKTKEQCIARFKLLAEHVKKRNQDNSCKEN
ncbi:dnaJ homolog subfamily C member 1 isoform X1 [Hydra vulgaris]|uniref:DnaJ homolog subfamily C member 1 n=1 Tax=Hydra vulgaris TaxID=6087 RepID=T2M7Q6_HYDVU|nr:dnaJ homolog subfamily C member 1 isoform X1 [Hydra vulgaris]